jgi:hypothetical protein
MTDGTQTATTAADLLCMRVRSMPRRDRMQALLTEQRMKPDGRQCDIYRSSARKRTGKVQPHL